MSTFSSAAPAPWLRSRATHTTCRPQRRWNGSRPPPATIREKIRQIDAALAAAKDAEARAAQATVIEAIVPRLQNSIASIGPALKELAGELHDCGVPEGRAASMLRRLVA